MMFKKATAVLALFLSTALFQGCTPAAQDALPRPQGTVPMVIDPGSHTYTDSTDEMAEITDSPSPSASQSSGDGAGSGSGSGNANLAKDLCMRVGDMAIEYSKISAEDTDAPYIAKVLEFDLISDNRSSVVAPDEGEVSVVIECRVLVELSTGDKGSVTIYELLDSDGMSRVRWDDYIPE